MCRGISLEYSIPLDCVQAQYELTQHAADLSSLIGCSAGGAVKEKKRRAAGLTILWCDVHLLQATEELKRSVLGFAAWLLQEPFLGRIRHAWQHNCSFYLQRTEEQTAQLQASFTSGLNAPFHTLHHTVQDVWEHVARIE